MNLIDYIEHNLKKARRMLKETRNGYDVEKWGPQMWEGYEAAFVKVRNKIRRDAKDKTIPADTQRVPSQISSSRRWFKWLYFE